MRYALIENGVIINIIELNPRNEKDFPTALAIPEDRPISINDTYDGEKFYHEDKEILSYEELKEISNNSAAINEETESSDHEV